MLLISGQLPTRTIPHCVYISPEVWFYWLVVVLVGVVLRIVNLVGNSWALFLSGGASCPTNDVAHLVTHKKGVILTFIFRHTTDKQLKEIRDTSRPNTKSVLYIPF